jgi:hypothetical protein
MYLAEAVKKCQQTTGQIIHHKHPTRWWSYEFVNGQHEFIEWPSGIRWTGLGFEDAFSDEWSVVESTAWVLKPCKGCSGVGEFYPRNGDIVVVGCRRCGLQYAGKSASDVVYRWNAHNG